MKGTKLWQDTGSPLISGRSRRQRPIWQHWLLAALVSWVLVTAVALALIQGWDLVQAAQLAGVIGVCALLVSGPFAWFTTKMGWRRPWLPSALATGLLVPVAAYFYITWALMTFGK